MAHVQEKHQVRAGFERRPGTVKGKMATCSTIQFLVCMLSNTNRHLRSEQLFARNTKTACLAGTRREHGRGRPR